MSHSGKKVDRSFLVAVSLLTGFGFIIFYSASLGILARSPTQYSSVTINQVVFGFALGLGAMLGVMRLDYRLWRKWAFFILLGAVIMNVLVLLPQIGFEHGGARRWLILSGVSFQTSEFLKLAVVIYYAAWASKVKNHAKDFKDGVLPLIFLLLISGVLLLLEPDTDTFIMIAFSLFAIFIVAGGKWRYVIWSVIIGLTLVASLAFTRPYIMKRIMTFVHPESDSLGASYQVQQSLIAIGSGKLTGRGFGQSIQKFNFLPEPIGDSIFAVEAEEFGFLGAVFLLGLFLYFALRGLKLASQTTDSFGRLLIVGLVIMIIAQAFVNIGAMLGVLPLSGITLPFVSHGGTSLLFTLLEAGIILSISRGIPKI